MSYEIPSDERTQRKARRDIRTNRRLTKFGAENSTQVDSTAFGAGSHDNATGVVTGNFVLNPESHIECIEVSWTGASGTLNIGDIVDTTASAWQGRFLHLVSGNSVAGTGIFEPQNATAFTDVAQTLSVGSTWTGATYTTSTLKTGRWVIQSASMILDTIDGSNPTLQTIYGAKNDGQVTTIKPKEGKTVTIVTGGNMDISSSTTINDDSFSVAQFHEDNITPDANGSWSLVGGAGSGGSSSNAIKTQVRVATTVDGTLATAYENGDTIDGVTLATGDRILIKDQSTGSENGIYTVNASGAPTRATDFDDSAEVVAGVLVVVEEGTANGDAIYKLVTNNPITVGTTALVFDSGLNIAGLDINDVHQVTFNSADDMFIQEKSDQVTMEFEAPNTGAFDFYVDRSGSPTPRFGILEDSLESNVDFDMNLNSTLYDDISTPSTDATRAKIYAKNDGGTIKTYTLWSDGTEKELGSGGGATTLNGLTDVTISTATLYNHLEYDGSLWRNQSIISQANNNVIRWRNAGDTDWASINVDASDEFNFNPATGTTEVQFNSLALTGVAHIENDGANRPTTGFLQLSSGTELVWRNTTNTDNLLFDNGTDAAGNQAFIFNIGAANQLTISNLDIDVLDNDIINTGDIEVGSGSHTVGTSGAPYNQMFSDFFVPDSATVVTNRYALGKDGNTIYVNFDNTNADAGFSIYEEGLESFRFYHPTSTVNSFHIGSSAVFTSGEEYRIQMGEGTENARIFLIEGTGNDLILDRASGGTDEGVQMRVSGLTIARFLSDELRMSQKIDMNSQNIIELKNVTADGTGSTIGELTTGNGGFDYYVDNNIRWDGDNAVQITMGTGGITIETNGTDDDIDILAQGTSSDIDIRAATDGFLSLGRPAVNHLQFGNGVTTFSSANITLSTGTEEIQFLDAVAGASATTPSAGDINLFNDATTGELSVKKSSGSVISLEDGGGISFPITPVIRDFGTTSGSITLELDGSDAGDGHVFKITMNGNVTFVFADPPSSGTQIEFEIEVTQNGTGGHTITWPASVNDEPIMPTTAGARAVFVGRTNDGGTTYDVIASSGGGIDFPVQYPVDRQGNKSGTVTHDLSANTAHKLEFTATGDCDITITNIPASASNAQDFYIEITQDGTGGHEITFNDSEVQSPPTIPTTADSVTLLALHADGDNVIRIIEVDSTANSGQTPWSSNIDADGFDLQDLSNIEFRETTGAPAGSTAAIWADSGGININVPTGDVLDYQVNGSSIMSISATQTTFADGFIVVCNPNGTNAGLNVGTHTADPSDTTVGQIYYNTTANEFRGRDNSGWVDLGGAGGGSQTPWTSDIDADGFDLNDLSNIEFRTSTGAPAAGTQGIWADATGIQINVPTGDHLEFLVQGSSVMQMTSGQTIFADGFKVQCNPDGTNAGLNVGLHTADPSTPANGDIFYNSTSNELRARINGAWISLGDGSQTPWLADIDADGFDLNNLSNIVFQNTATPPVAGVSAIWADSGGININVPTGDVLDFQIQGSSIMQINGSQTIFKDGFKIICNPDSTNAGLNVGLNTADPSSPSNGDIFYNSTSNELRARINGAWVDLGSGGSQTPWTSDIDADGFDLTDLSNIEFRNTTGAPASGQAIWADSGGLNFRTSDGTDSFDFQLGGTSEIRLDPDGEIVFVQDDHKIIPQSGSLDFETDLTSHEFKFKTGGSRSNETIEIADTITTWKTSDSELNPLRLELLHNHDTPSTQRVIGSLDGYAENSISTDTLYARIEMSTSNSVTSGSESGRVQIEVKTNGSSVPIIECAGNSASSTGRLGFFGTSEVDQQSVASDTLANLYTALRNYGLIA